VNPQKELPPALVLTNEPQLIAPSEEGPMACAHCGDPCLQADVEGLQELNFCCTGC